MSESENKDKKITKIKKNNSNKQLSLKIEALQLNKNLKSRSPHHHEYKSSSPQLGEEEISGQKNNNLLETNNETPELKNSLKNIKGKIRFTSLLSPRKNESEMPQTEIILSQNTNYNNGSTDIKVSEITQNNKPVREFNTEIKTSKKIRRDCFGRIIRKNGKHKVSFADEVFLLEQMGHIKRPVDDYEPAHETIDIINYDIQGVKKGKSSKTLRENNNQMMIINNENIRKNPKKKKGEGSNHLVEYIDVSSYKKDNKENSFLPDNFGEPTTVVCCSQMCIIL